MTTSQKQECTPINWNRDISKRPLQGRSEKYRYTLFQVRQILTKTGTKDNGIELLYKKQWPYKIEQSEKRINLSNSGVPYNSMSEPNWIFVVSLKLCRTKSGPRKYGVGKSKYVPRKVYRRPKLPRWGEEKCQYKATNWTRERHKRTSIVVNWSTHRIIVWILLARR